MPLFTLGQTVATPAAIEVLTKHNINAAELLRRHAYGDWGSLGEEDLKANQNAITYGGRIFSVYLFGDDKLWVITEADYSSTCILLPSDY